MGPRMGEPATSELTLRRVQSLPPSQRFFIGETHSDSEPVQCSGDASTDWYSCTERLLSEAAVEEWMSELLTYMPREKALQLTQQMHCWRARRCALQRRREEQRRETEALRANVAELRAKSSVACSRVTHLQEGSPVSMEADLQKFYLADALGLWQENGTDSRNGAGGGDRWICSEGKAELTEFHLADGYCPSRSEAISGTSSSSAADDGQDVLSSCDIHE
mmetsp:Transcript_54636/g.98066  ORF Transcript_54636/g.98066 Transcript_54636/m.98066 type:complete len:221 (-) Transcript_54636:300-962(-)